LIDKISELKTPCEFESWLSMARILYNSSPYSMRLREAIDGAESRLKEINIAVEQARTLEREAIARETAEIKARQAANEARARAEAQAAAEAEMAKARAISEARDLATRAEAEARRAKAEEEQAVRQAHDALPDQLRSLVQLQYSLLPDMEKRLTALKKSDPQTELAMVRIGGVLFLRLPGWLGG
jgi:hypothetical protein